MTVGTVPMLDASNTIHRGCGPQMGHKQSWVPKPALSRLAMHVSMKALYVWVLGSTGCPLTWFFRNLVRYALKGALWTLFGEPCTKLT